MSSTRGLALSLLAIALIPKAVLAGAPMSYDGWSVSAGSVAASCQSGFSCSSLNSGPGFLQRSIRDNAAGKTYFQTIVTGTAATGVAAAGLAFSDESFVHQGTGTAEIVGLADKQVIKSDNVTGTATQHFDSLVLIQAGWAATAGTPTIDITQNISEVTTSKINYKDSVRIRSNSDSAGNETGINMSVDTLFTEPAGTDQTGGDGGGSLSSTYIDRQQFALRRVAGDMLKTAGTALLPASSSSSCTPSRTRTCPPPVTNSVSWNPGQDMTVSWTGQIFTLRGETESIGTIGAEGTMMGFQSYSNFDTGATARVLNFGSTGPYGTWPTDPFGAAPAMPAGLPFGQTGPGGGG